MTTNATIATNKADSVSPALQAERTANADYAAELKEEIATLRAERDAFRCALNKIAAIEDKMYGGDWDEIEEARAIASAALKGE